MIRGGGGFSPEGDRPIGGFAGRKVGVYNSGTWYRGLEQFGKPLVNAEQRRFLRVTAQAGLPELTAESLANVGAREQLAGKLMRRALRADAWNVREWVQDHTKMGLYEAAGEELEQAREKASEAEVLHRRYGKPGSVERYERRYRKKPFAID